FASNEAAESHRTHPRKHWICDVCTLDFWSKEDRLNHYKTSSNHHTCASCGKDYSTAAKLRQPIFKHSTKSFGCDKWNRTFLSDEIMPTHIKSTIHHPLVFKCPGCQAKSATISALVAHIEAKTCSEGISYGTSSVGKMLRHLWQNINS
ncbi:hypothetical protein BDR22DRAFT_806737, partial [Usnea florida]